MFGQQLKSKAFLWQQGGHNSLERKYTFSFLACTTIGQKAWEAESATLRVYSFQFKAKSKRPDSDLFSEQHGTAALIIASWNIDWILYGRLCVTIKPFLVHCLGQDSLNSAETRISAKTFLEKLVKSSCFNT